MVQLITKIEVQRSNKSRLNIFVDDDLYIDISKETYLKVKPKKGQEIATVLEELNVYENYNVCYSTALNFLARRQHGTKELEKKLEIKGYDKESIDRVIEKINSLGYLDDDKFKESFVSDKQGLQLWGRIKIEYELEKIGVSSSFENYNYELELNNAKKHAIKKIKKLKPREQNGIHKVKQYLNSKGFEYSIVSDVLNEIDIDKVLQKN